MILLVPVRQFLLKRPIEGNYGELTPIKEIWMYVIAVQFQILTDLLHPL